MFFTCRFQNVAGESPGPRPDSVCLALIEAETAKGQTADVIPLCSPGFFFGAPQTAQLERRGPGRPGRPGQAAAGVLTTREALAIPYR